MLCGQKRSSRDAVGYASETQRGADIFRNTPRSSSMLCTSKLPPAALATPTHLGGDAALDTATCQCIAGLNAFVSPKRSLGCSDESAFLGLLLRCCCRAKTGIEFYCTQGAWSKCYSPAVQHQRDSPCSSCTRYSDSAVRPPWASLSAWRSLSLTTSFRRSSTGHCT